MPFFLCKLFSLNLATDYLKLHTLKKPSKVGVFYKFCIVSCQKTACWIRFEDKTIRKITQHLFTDICLFQTICFKCKVKPSMYAIITNGLYIFQGVLLGKIMSSCMFSG